MLKKRKQRVLRVVCATGVERVGDRTHGYHAVGYHLICEPGLPG